MEYRNDRAREEEGGKKREWSRSISDNGHKFFWINDKHQASDTENSELCEKG